MTNPLDEYLRLRAITNKDFSRESCIPEDVVSHLRRGSRKPTSEQMVLIQLATSGAVQCVDWIDVEEARRRGREAIRSRALSRAARASSEAA